MQVAATFVSLTQLRVMVLHAASPQKVAVASYKPNPYPPLPLTLPLTLNP